jgi:hypothetical protein
VQSRAATARSVHNDRQPARLVEAGQSGHGVLQWPLGSGTVVANALIHGVDGVRNQIWLAETNIDRIDVHTYSPCTPAAICA